MLPGRRSRRHDLYRMLALAAALLLLPPGDNTLWHLAQPAGAARRIAAPQALPASIQITITNAGPSPGRIVIRPGTFVTWYNAGSDALIQSGTRYSIALPLLMRPEDTAGATPAATQDAEITSATAFGAFVRSGRSFTYQFNEIGVFPYTISVLPFAQGIIDVQDPALLIFEPQPDIIVRETLQINALLHTQANIVSAQATVGSRSTSLTQEGRAYCDGDVCDTEWRGSLALDGLGRGSHSLVVTATDALANVYTATQPFFHDRLPTLRIASPLPEAVARPDLHLDISCLDDDPAGCASIQVSLLDPSGRGPIIASGATRISASVSLTSYWGQELRLRITARDSSGAVITDERIVYCDYSTSLAPIVQTPGALWDVSPTHLLYLDQTSQPPALMIRDLASGLDTQISGDKPLTPQYGFLTPTGAIFAEQSGDSTTARVKEWRSGVLTDLGQLNSLSSLKVSGNYAIWSEGQTLILRDLAAGTNTTVATNASNWFNDVSANGDVAYWASSIGAWDVYRYRQGARMQLTDDRGALWNTFVKTDGINVAYRKFFPHYSAQTYRIMLASSAGEEVLAELRESEPLPGPDYQLNGGWAAYTDIDRLGKLQVWTRSPLGVKAAVTAFATSSSIDALAPNGQVMVTHEGIRYLGNAGSGNAGVSSALGRSFWQDGEWHIIIGGTLFKIVN